MKTIKPTEVLPGQIIYVNLIFLNKKKQKIIVKEQVISRDYDSELKVNFNIKDDEYYFDKHKIKEDNLILDKIHILAYLGFKNKTNDYVSANLDLI
jgi:hypothetical protein